MMTLLQGPSRHEAGFFVSVTPNVTPAGHFTAEERADFS